VVFREVDACLVMQHDLQLPKVLVLAAIAILLGVALLELNGGRPKSAVAASNAPAAASAPAAAQPAAPAADPAGTLVADPAPVVDAAPVVQRRAGVVCSEPHRLVQVPRDSVIRSAPGGRRIGALPSSSRYLGQPMTAWVQAVSANGKWGRVSVPWTKPVTRSGWVPIVGLQGRTTSIMAVADLSTRRMTVYRGCRELFSVSTAVGRPGSPSPTGRFWVTDRVPVPSSQRSSFGTFAFGLSTVQPNLPAHRARSARPRARVACA
jgi:hypothetical protein